jgi:hypothetical protein
MINRGGLSMIEILHVLTQELMPYLYYAYCLLLHPTHLNHLSQTAPKEASFALLSKQNQQQINQLKAIFPPLTSSTEPFDATTNTSRSQTSPTTLFSILRSSSPRLTNQPTHHPISNNFQISGPNSHFHHSSSAFVPNSNRTIYPQSPSSDEQSVLNLTAGLYLPHGSSIKTPNDLYKSILHTQTTPLSISWSSLTHILNRCLFKQRHRNHIINGGLIQSQEVRFVVNVG